MTDVARLRVGLIGDPVAHSISPAMQQPALDALGIPATYELWQTSADQLSERVASLRAPGALGANVTVPHKLAVMKHLDEVSDLARQAGAVNTIFAREERLRGDNTDVYGFSTALIDAIPDAAGRSALILGAGGAARAVVLALEQCGVRSITIANRNVERAARLAAELAPVTADVIELAGNLLPVALSSTGILINATSLGWHPGESPIDASFLGELPPEALVVDLTYRDTDLLRAARARKIQTLDGLAMLVHQGARAFELWTGKTPPVDVMVEAARQARASRG